LKKFLERETTGATRRSEETEMERGKKKTRESPFRI